MHRSSDKISRFEKEIAFLKCQSHPNVIKIIGQGGCENNKKFYVMPLYKKTLRDVILEEKNAEMLIGYWIKLTQAVQYIHSIGVYHRDIKPENIFIHDSGELVLADFGIAHFNNSTTTKKGEWLGNKAYAAPEQLEKENKNDVSAASDVYALGKILNELFTKSNPSGLKYEQIRHTYTEYWELDTLVEKCLSQNPSERPSSKYLLQDVLNIQKKVHTNLDFIENVLMDELEGNMSDQSIIAIAHVAAKDIYLARYILEHRSIGDIKNDESVLRYHNNIRYAVDNFVKSIYFQKKILRLCEAKFAYEANIYAEGNIYCPINLGIEANLNLYHSFRATALKYRYQADDFGKILKLFLSCCDYHCQDLMNAAKQLEQELICLNNAPLFDLLYKLRTVFSKTEAKVYDIAGHIVVDWIFTVEDLS